ncbi:MAG: NAD(P)-dependent oxidoreductase [Calditrichia bacterium]
MDVFFYEAFEEEQQAIASFLPNGIKAGFTWKTIQESGDRQPPAPLISIRTQSIIPPQWASHLQGLLTRSTGYDHMLAYREKTGAGIPAGYLPLYCNRAVAEQAMLLWMALLRKLPQQQQQFQSFHRDGLTGQECRDKTLLVVGVGNIGSEVVKIGNGLGMNVLGVDLVQHHAWVNYTPPEAGLPVADIVVCAMNLTPENHSYFNERRLALLKKGALFINIARGEMSPPETLLKFLKNGHIGGVAMDVFDRESELAVALRSGKTAGSPRVEAVLQMAGLPNVIFTPHNAFNTEESVRRKAEQSIEQITHFLEQGCFKWPVP